ncbi:LamG-like jellyroll fold domain-containing protein [Flavobacterium pectinovorum]|uniref:T9SS type A sorting domain-containing protein n=1 Tax=Flavobacterium pectinovorum TaxID=29533 RepID=UPI001FABB59F|nr:LamG-like jellyroll fold domain-containing protein [Flavobacterium pectinovorum]MCI9843929.1 T9SS type A sorting domain-containing protein [Flavobacterium pectinovorum]
MKKILLSIALALPMLGFSQATTSGLISYFNFENTLNSNSTSHNFTNGTSTNVTYSNGKYGQGVVFGGASALVNATLTDAATLGVNSTIAWWEFRPIGIPNNYSTSFEMSEALYYRAQNVSSCNNGSYSNRYELGINAGGWACLTLQQQSAMAGSWHHHAIVKQAGVINYYLDGVLNIGGWLLNDQGINGTTNKFIFGGGTNNGVINNSKCMNGTLDELYIYNRALTASEILNVKNATNATTTGPVSKTGLLAFYNFENNNNNFDNTHNLTNGTATNATYDNGMYGQSVAFSGSQALVNTTIYSALNSGEYSVAFWEKRTTPPNIYSTSFEFFGVHYFRAAGNLSCGFKSPTNTAWSNLMMGATGTYLNTWTHYAFVWSTETDGYKRMKCYINGQLVVSSSGYTAAATIEQFNTIFSVGGGTSTDGNLHPSKYYTGNLDEFYIYNRAITDIEIMNIMGNSSGVTLSNQDFVSKNSNVFIYPNPTSDNFTIETENEVKSVEIFSLPGQKIASFTTKNINVSNLKKGIYLVRIEDNENNVTTQKLIIK